MLKSIPRPSRRLFLITCSLLVPLFLEAFLHWRTFDIPRPGHDLDPPYQVGCREPPSPSSSSSRPKNHESAALVMLAQNSEREAARRTVASVEARFNRWFHYPYVFLNDQPWDPAFVAALNATVSGPAAFEVIPAEEWTYPPWVDRAAARESIVRQGERGVHYGGRESYHHMCRFFSGKFYTLEALRPYKWYWRLEPDVDFACSITYDPFAEMAARGHAYGWTISLWEEPDTCPTLFRAVSDWREARRLPGNDLWRAMAQASWLPAPLRGWLGGWRAQHDRRGDAWSLCHYWSNFEIADLDFFRGREYQELFEYLDRKGGFYSERWGDAAVHSLAVGMLLGPERVHHFSDFAYRHDSFQQCPANAPGFQFVNDTTATSSSSSSSHFSSSSSGGGGGDVFGEDDDANNILFTTTKNRMRRGPPGKKRVSQQQQQQQQQGLGEHEDYDEELAGEVGGGGRVQSTSPALGSAPFAPEQDGGVGCRCTCDAPRGRTINYPGYCTNKLKQPTRPERYWFTWFL